jgi:hypothetical protein
MPEFKRRNYGRGHGYTLDGEKLPGVTTILSDGLSKPALVKWGINTVANYATDNWNELAELKPSERTKKLTDSPYADRDAAAKRGTEVHALGEKLVRGEEVTVPDELAGHVDSYVKFLDRFQPGPVMVEQSVVAVTKWPYAGTLDGIFDFPTLRKRLLVDLKTARSGVFPDNALQLSAYRHATHYASADDGWQLHPMIPVDGCAVIHVASDHASLVPVETGPEVFRAFLYAREMWRWANETSKTVIGEELQP